MARLRLRGFKQTFKEPFGFSTATSVLGSMTGTIYQALHVLELCLSSIGIAQQATTTGGTPGSVTM